MTSTIPSTSTLPSSLLFRRNMILASRFFALFTIVWCLAVFAVGCSLTWVSEATNIIQLLVPAISSILSILTAFGAGISPNAMADINNWAQQATTGLETVGTLITQYNTAEAAAQPGILIEIQTALSVVVNNLATVLPELHITDAATQAKVVAIMQAVQSEITALMNVIPAIQGKVTSHEELKGLIAKVQSAKEFKAEFNGLVGGFGSQYQLK